MESIWKRGGLDLQLSCYRCLPTGDKEGLIQMVPEAETIGRIQMEVSAVLIQMVPEAETICRNQMEIHRSFPPGLGMRS